MAALSFATTVAISSRSPAARNSSRNESDLPEESALDRPLLTLLTPPASSPRPRPTFADEGSAFQGSPRGTASFSSRRGRGSRRSPAPKGAFRERRETRAAGAGAPMSGRPPHRRASGGPRRNRPQSATAFRARPDGTSPPPATSGGGRSIRPQGR